MAEIPHISMDQEAETEWNVGQAINFKTHPKQPTSSSEASAPKVPQF